MRTKLIGAAIDCFARDGLEGGTLEKVAAKNRVRRSHVAYYYSTKDELFTDVIKFIILNSQEMNIAAIQNAQTTREKILAMHISTISWVEKFPKHGKILLLFYYLASIHPKYRKLYEKIRDTGYQRVLALLKENANEFKYSIDYESEARQLHSIMISTALDMIALNKNKDIKYKKLGEKIMLDRINFLFGNYS